MSKKPASSLTSTPPEPSSKRRTNRISAVLSRRPYDCSMEMDTINDGLPQSGLVLVISGVGFAHGFELEVV